LTKVDVISMKTRKRVKSNLKRQEAILRRYILLPESAAITNIKRVATGSLFAYVLTLKLEATRASETSDCKRSEVNHIQKDTGLHIRERSFGREWQRRSSSGEGSVVGSLSEPMGARRAVKEPRQLKVPFSNSRGMGEVNDSR
jgi:hypothetical protein